MSAPYLRDGLKDFHETWVTCSPHQGDVQNPRLDNIGSMSRSRLKVKGLRLYFVSAPYLPDGLKDFHETWVTCSPHQGDVQNLRLDNIGSMSRSRLKVKGLRLYFVSAPYLPDGLKDFNETLVTCSPHQGDVQNPCLDNIGSRSRSRLKVKGLRLYFVSAPYLQDGLKDFHETWVTCSPHQGDVHNPRLDHTGSRSRSRLKVKGLRLYFVSTPYLQDGLKYFHETWVRCSPHQGDVQNPRLDHTGSRSRLKVKGLRLYFVSTPYLLKGFS